MSGWRLAFATAHIVTLCAVGALYSNYSFVTASPAPDAPIYAIIGQQIPASRITEAAANPDALQIAYNVGVLELLSLGITILGIVLALSAVFGFWMIRGAAIRAARETADGEFQKWSETRLRELFDVVTELQRGTAKPNINISSADVGKAIDEASEIKGV